MVTDHSSARTDSSAILESARRALRAERRCLEDERAAFERFRARVDRLEAITPRPTDAGAPGSTPSRGLDSVREAYGETVMDVPHFREAYDESCVEHLGNELGEELAAALTHDSQLFVHVKRGLLRASEAATDSRETLLERIDAERANVEEFAETLEECRAELASLLDQPVDHMEFNALRLTRVRLHGLRDRCDELTARRQAFLRRHRRTLPGGFEGFGSYVYDGCNVDHPVLAAIVAFVDRLERACRAVERKLTSVA